jgi:hypothetical protein
MQLSLGRIIRVAAALSAWLAMSSCSTSAGTGALAGGGIGALAGQVIGHDTESTLIGAAVGTGIGYIIGNEKDKDHAVELESASHATPPTNNEVAPLGGSRWRVTSIHPSNAVPAHTSKIVEFRPDGRVITTTTSSNGHVQTADESYRVVNTTLIINKPGYLVNAQYRITGDQMTVTADKFTAELQRLPG